MQQSELELSVGDILRLGNHLVTIVDIHDDEVTFKVVDTKDLTESVSPIVRPK